jgi:ubiquitin C-terminal hydrolase
MNPKGFYNLGNTCYINSVLQNIIYNESFIQKINNIEIKKIIESKEEVFNLSSFINYFLEKYTFFERFTQNDAHEFLTSFIDLIVEENNLFKEDYHGETRLNIKCSNCKNTKQVFEEFTSINLNVEKNCNLFDLFEKYLSKEIHDDPKNLYFCDHCKCNCISEKKISLNVLPKTLIIVFKRYSEDGKKLSNIIDFPIGSLNVRESKTGKLLSYNLTGIVNHMGNLSDGHYNSFVNINGNWYFMDDNIVLRRDSIYNNQSYILFYQLIEPKIKI